MLTEEQRIKARAAQRAWYARNKEKAHAATAAYRAAHPEKIRGYERKYYEKNRTKIIERNKGYTAANKEKVREYYRQYCGLPEALRPEPTHCECCGRLPGRSGRLELDHCHETGAFRGWLCHRCNLGLGNLGDTKQGLLKALEYLERVECQTPPQ